MRFVWIEDKNSSVTPDFFIVSDRFALHIKKLCIKHEEKKRVEAGK